MHSYLAKDDAFLDGPEPLIRQGVIKFLAQSGIDAFKVDLAGGEKGMPAAMLACWWMVDRVKIGRIGLGLLTNTPRSAGPC